MLGGIDQQLYDNPATGTGLLKIGATPHIHLATGRFLLLGVKASAKTARIDAKRRVLAGTCR